jgi:hypothetical protein
MTSQYSYALARGNYYCLSCSPLKLAWILLTKVKKLHLESLGIQRRQVPAILKSLLNYSIKPPFNSTDVINLPVSGHVCIRVHHGYKVFDLSTLTATKVFDANYNTAAVASEIQAVVDASVFVFTPNFLSSDPNQHWYTESFISGKRFLKTVQSDPQILFESVIVDYILNIILSKSICATKLGDYLNTLIESIFKHLLNLSHVKEVVIEIEFFVDSIVSDLENKREIQLYLAFTHGDFSFVNFLGDKHNIVVIDWESAQNRSALHDLYNYFLTELYYGRTKSNLLLDIDNAIVLIGQRLALDEPDISKHIDKYKGIYRGLYYLERLNTLLDRDPSVDHLNVIKRSIDVFKIHESSMSHSQAK